MACKGIIGLFFEIVVLACIVGGICANIYVIASCDMLVFPLGAGSFGPWREDVSGQGCVTWDKNQVDSDWILNMARVTSVMAGEYER